MFQVIHRRDDYGVPAENFNRDWNDYKNGFGDPSKEFWLGNENIYMLTNNDDYMLRVELEDFDGNKRYAPTLLNKFTALLKWLNYLHFFKCYCRRMPQMFWTDWIVIFTDFFRL